MSLLFNISLYVMSLKLSSDCKFIDCFIAESKNPLNECPANDTKESDGEFQ